MDPFLENLRGNQSSSYGILALIGITLSLLYWTRAAKGDPRLLPIYFASLGGAFVGAKLSYLLAEGWLHTGPNWWIHWLWGKSITGALFGGYFGVELSKKLTEYTIATGDRFAFIVPLAVVIGRFGCLNHGCCQGVTFSNGFHWPAVPAEIIFNLLIWSSFFSLKNKPWSKGQLFHLYLIAYDSFRFLHEFLRATPKIGGIISGYQIVALILVALGLIRFRQRAKAI